MEGERTAVMAKVTQAHVDARRESILEAAMRLFAGKSVDRTTMQEIASEAGISAGAIYRYFESKDQLLEAVFEAAEAETAEKFRAAAADNTSPLAAMVQAGYSALDQPCGCTDSMMALEMALLSARNPGSSFAVRHRQFETAVIASLEHVVRDAQAAGEMAPDLDAHTIAMLGYAIIPGLWATQMVLGDEFDARSVIQVLGTLFRRSAIPHPQES
ncbi:MAG: TetR/AcrR family transcriptional regulator [Dehalococcoidia bacterium]|nr:TetR/AcrR family transcriptional regulator [Dehalococcoidia bacterium]